MLPTSRSTVSGLKTPVARRRYASAGYRLLRRTIRHRPLLPVSFFPHSSAETLISVLQEFVSSAEGLAPATFSPLAIAPTNDSTSVWLTHPEAAKCLGISTTTLYRYVEQERIEFRKIGNRLEYRRSTLDQFKEQHVRSARRPRRQEV